MKVAPGAARALIENAALNNGVRLVRSLQGSSGFDYGSTHPLLLWLCALPVPLC